MTVTTTEQTESTESTPDGNEATAPSTSATVTPTANHLVESDLLVEDVSIDGMCGVY